MGYLVEDPPEHKPVGPSVQLFVTEQRSDVLWGGPWNRALPGNIG